MLDAEDQPGVLRDRERLGEVGGELRRRLARADRVDVDAQEADRLDRRQVRAQRTRERSRLAVVAHEHLEHGLEAAVVEERAELLRVDPELVLDLARPVAADLHRVEAGRRRERELLRGRAPVAAGEAAEEPPQHPDVH